MTCARATRPRLSFRVAGKIVERGKWRWVAGQARADCWRGSTPATTASTSSRPIAARRRALRLPQAKDELQRFRELFEKKFISAAEFDRRQNAYDVAKARLEQAQAQLGVTRNQSAYTTLARRS